ncbi:MAG: ATP-binding protein [Defluviitaleaceae bacterium]|nr:ATP-binding protein [Defluviitaleaceae bacterium]
MRKKLNELVEARTRELEAQAALITSLLDTIPDVIFVKDLNYRIAHHNQAFAKLFDLEGREIHGKTEFDIGFSYDDALRMREADEKVIKTGATITEEDAQPYIEGTVDIYETIKTPLVRDGEIIGLVGIGRDITRRKELEQTIQKNYEYARALSKSLAKITQFPDTFAEDVYTAMALIMKEAAVALDVQRVSVWKLKVCETGLENVYMYNAQTGTSTILDDYSIENQPIYTKQLQSARLIIVDNASQDLEMPESYKKGLCALLETPVRIDGILFGIIGFEQEYSEKYPRKRVWTIEEQTYASSLGDIMALVISGDERRRASRAKSDFLATMSHEIRTPMNSIVGFSELALGGNIPPTTRDYLSKIRDSSHWLLQIINDILDLAKIESGKIEMEKIPFNLQTIFSNCRAAITPKALEKNLNLHFYAEPSLGKVPLGDPTKLQQVLMNLLSNAVKFTNTGIIKLLADVKHESENSITIFLEVKDSGIGMTKAQLKRVFSPFTQAESGTKRKYGGTGLGLSITKNMIELMGGELEVESTPGVGSKFSFTLTFEAMAVSSDEGTADIIESHDMKKPEFSGEVLICEDNVLNQQVVCEQLASVGIKTVVAENGKIGVEKVRERVDSGAPMFNLIFMDIHMPVMDGLEALERILAFETGVPVVALTANVMVHDRLLYKEKGMSDCLGKPFSSHELWRCLVKYFEPLGWHEHGKDQQHEADNALQQNLIARFVKSNQNKFAEISEAIARGDFVEAHRMAHTLKSNAGQLKKTPLQKAAGEMEHLLRDGAGRDISIPLRTLETELESVLAELSPLVVEADPNIVYLDGEASRKILDEVAPIIDDSDPECLGYIDELRRIQGSEPLILQLEDFNFTDAARELKILRERV